MSKKNVEIYVVSHKRFNPVAGGCYKTIAVGPGLLSDKSFHEYLRDDSGDNISSKNPNYCELTAHYWMWKNSKADVIGLCHYRRYFTTKVFSDDPAYIPDEKQILSILDSGYDIVLPYRPVARRTVKEIYCDFGFTKDLDTLRAVLSEKYPEYLGEYDALMERHSNYPANMMICSKALFDEYSAWLFDILFEVEKRTDLTGYTPQQARIYGFMSERLLEVWVRQKKLKIKHLRLVNTEKTYTLKSRCTEVLGIALNRFKY
ncbi:MAG: DUF4422 domain-containing protein [Ruminococcus sp.]|nr:DUF4422 domain-containing protein [Ruminococcus sp.]